MKVWYFNLMPWPHHYGDIPYPFPGKLYDRRLGTELYQNYLSLYRRADELGFDALGFAEHHYTKVGTAPSPNIMAAAVAAQTENAKIVLLGDCLPLHGHPVRLAEELAMIDTISGGRLIAGFIRGGLREYRAYGVDISQGRAMFEEAWDLIVKAWTEDEPFAWHGEHYHYDIVSIIPRPVQRPHPPIVQAGASAESIEWTARHHVPLLMAYDGEHTADGFAYYKRYATEQCGWTPEPEDMGMTSSVYVSTSDDKALEEARDAVLGHNRELATLLSQGNRGAGAARNSERSFAYRTSTKASREDKPDADYESLVRERYNVGSPETVIRKLKEKQKQVGFGTLVMTSSFGSLDPGMARRSVELFAREVLPHLR